MTRTVNTEKKRNFCKFCNKIIKGSSYKFKSHLFFHDAVKARYKCEYCSKEYFRLDTYTRHVASHNQNTQGKHTKKYICDYCDRVFLSKYNIIAHMKKIHDDGLKFDLKRFTCKACDISYCEQRILDRHIRKTHFNIEARKEPSHFKKSINESWIEKVESKNVCVQMTKLHNNVIIIQKYMKLDDVKVNNVKLKMMNYASHVPGQYTKVICDYCKKKMLKKSLHPHIRECHFNIRKYNCLKCNKTYKRHYQLVDHNCHYNI